MPPPQTKVRTPSLLEQYEYAHQQDLQSSHSLPQQSDPSTQQQSHFYPEFNVPAPYTFPPNQNSAPVEVLPIPEAALRDNILLRMIFRDKV